MLCSGALQIMVGRFSCSQNGWQQLQSADSLECFSTSSTAVPHVYTVLFQCIWEHFQTKHRPAVIHFYSFGKLMGLWNILGNKCQVCISFCNMPTLFKSSGIGNLVPKCLLASTSAIQHNDGLLFFFLRK